VFRATCRGRPVPRWRKMRKGNRWRACEG
jgi:hypothetical protein